MPQIDPYLEEEWETSAGGDVERDPFAHRKNSETGDWADGVRPPYICESAADVRLFILGDEKRGIPPAPSPRPVIWCGLCGKRKRHESKDVEDAVVWLVGRPGERGHTCDHEGVPLPDPNDIPDEVWFEIQEAA